VQKKLDIDGVNRFPDIQVIDPNTGKVVKIIEVQRDLGSKYHLNRLEEYDRLGIPYEVKPVPSNGQCR
jgi:hypothetical protein